MGSSQSTRSTVSAWSRSAGVRTQNGRIRKTGLKDSRDPDHDDTTTATTSSPLNENLKILGQVHVSSLSQPVTRSLRTQPSASSSPPILPLDAFRLSHLLDERKDGRAVTIHSLNVTSLQLERLAKRYNTPSIGRENTLPLPNGDTRSYKEAVWIEALSKRTSDSNV